MRNSSPFTDRQRRLLEAIREQIRALNDPEPEIITHEACEWVTEDTKTFGKIPKIRFRPYACRTKAELVKQAGLVDEAKEHEIVQLRKLYSIREVRNKEARLFESEWNNIMLKAKKAAFTLALINSLFSTHNQTVSEPIRLLQSIVLLEYGPDLGAQRKPIHGTAPERDLGPGYDAELEKLN
ncbi:MAG: hypothetical protein C4582_05285 [Desulfobacteraceae bacterium]|jgi:hypothetical protein|nr:MAG: hypothetical protein C4582_05285 [Desulfobacteraceae bacterium]